METQNKKSCQNKRNLYLFTLLLIPKFRRINDSTLSAHHTYWFDSYYFTKKSHIIINQETKKKTRKKGQLFYFENKMSLHSFMCA